MPWAAVGLVAGGIAANALAPDAPDYPDPIDPGKSSLDYILSISDPAVQEKILAAERRGREQYLSLGLRDLKGTLEGYGGQEGTVSILNRILPQISDMQAQALSAQRESDIADIERLGTRATDALRASDPELQKLLEQQGALTSGAYERAGGVTAQQQRLAEQQARAAGTARGRGMGQSTIAAEILGREDFQRQNRQEAQQAGVNYFEMLKRSSADPFQAILGRPGTAYGGATQQQGFGAGFMGSQMGPQLYDPNAGVNLALMQQTNKANYNANVYGAQSGMYGQIWGGVMSGLGSMAGAGCWVARACYGEDDERWQLFRLWLFTHAPGWFSNLYIKYGEQFGAWVKDRPAIKWMIRKWMDGRIATLKRNMEVCHG